MKTTGGGSERISVREDYHYFAELGRYAHVRLEKTYASVEVSIPYHPSRIHRLDAQSDYPIGKLRLEPATDPSAATVLPIELLAGDGLRANALSARRAVVTAEYDVADPEAALLTIDAEVFDADAERIKIRNPEAFGNGLGLRIFLWVPDIWRQSKEDESQEVARMLLRGEDVSLALLPVPNGSVESIRVLAETMAGLANSGGGSVFLGVNGSEIIGIGESAEARRTRLEDLLMRATLLCSPPVRFAPPRFVPAPNRKVVCRVDVPPALEKGHEVAGSIVRRAGKANVYEQVGHREPTNITTAYVDDLLDETGNLRVRNSPTLISLDATQGVERLELGKCVSGLTNSTSGHGRIALKLAAGDASRTAVIQQIESHLSEELAKLAPRPVLAPVATTQAGEYTLAVLSVPRSSATITLYDGTAYEWTGGALQPLPAGAAYRRCMAGFGYGDSDIGAGQVRLAHARLHRPVAPAQPLRLQRTRAPHRGDSRTAERVVEVIDISYDHQLRADVWKPEVFQHSGLTGGYLLQLSAPLRDIALNLDEDGHVYARDQARVSGVLEITIEGLLASGLKVTREAQNSPDGWLDELPLFKSTRLIVNFDAFLYELFERRSRASYLDFWAPNVMLDSDRLEDVAQAFADNGFRLGNVDGPVLSSDTGKWTAVLTGTRGHGYCDIRFEAYLECETRAVTRELRYEEQRIETRPVRAANLHLRVGMWGAGDAAPPGVSSAAGRDPFNADQDTGARPPYYNVAVDQIPQLQMALHHTLKQRLLHLGAE